MINEEQAQVVRRIFKLYLNGYTPTAIAKTLMEEGIPSPSGRPKWYSNTIMGILTNEKHKGAALLQKTYTADYLTKQVKKNHGEVQQYYIEDEHPAIIEPVIFDMVQQMIKLRNPGKNRTSCANIYSSKIVCGDCGSWYGGKIWHSTDKYRKMIWRCNHKYDDGKKCSTPNLTEDEIKYVFISALNLLIGQKPEILKKYMEIMDYVFSVDELLAKKERLMQEMSEAADRVRECIARNARVALNQTDYQAEYDSLAKEFEDLQSQVETVDEMISDRNVRRGKTERFLRDLSGMSLVEEFDESIWYSLLDHMTVYSKEDIRVMFKDGTEIKTSV